MIDCETSLDTFNFSVAVNHDKIERNFVNYFGFYLDDELTSKNQIDNPCNKFSKVCGMIFKLKDCVSLSALKLGHYSLFHSNLISFKIKF